MLLFCVGLATQSIIDISGETHEWVLHANAGDAYAHGHHHHHAPDEDHGSGDAVDPLHVLLHQPCGGHCVFMAAGQPSPQRVDLKPATLPAENLRPIPRSGYQAPFRPPIPA